MVYMGHTLQQLVISSQDFEESILSTLFNKSRVSGKRVGIENYNQ